MGQIKKRIGITYLLLVFILMASILSGIMMGSAGYNPGELILYRIRMPRLIMAAMLGGALALAGYLLQTYFRNPIAGPYILGISSGAKLSAAIVLIGLMKEGIPATSMVLIIAAFVGATISTGFIIILSTKVKNLATLLVGGIMINYICSAITELMITFASESDIANLHNWSQGSFSGVNMEQCRAAVILVLLAAVFVFFLSKPIYALQLGEDYAGSMGVNTGLFRKLLLMIACLLSATVTAFAGPVSFVGIAVPFLIKAILQTAKPIVVIPGIFLGGAIFCVICDTVARCLMAPVELNISTVTSIVGAPIVIFMLIGRRR